MIVRKEERRRKSKFLLDLKDPRTVVRVGDCRTILPSMKKGIVDCVFADQPYNIGVDYAEWDDNLSPEEFWTFTKAWIDGCIHVLSPCGSFFAWLPPSLASRVSVYLQDKGLHPINDIVVVQRFGQHTRGKLISGHVRLLYFAKDPDCRTWNTDSILVPSLRASKYADKRTQSTKTPGKRAPLDVWGLDEPYFGRVQGNNAERCPLHPNQVPEAVVARALLATTNEGDLVLDPFLGSGTTCTVARALGRRSIGIELSPEYARSASERIERGPARPIALSDAEEASS